MTNSDGISRNWIIRKQSLGTEGLIMYNLSLEIHLSKLEIKKENWDQCTNMEVLSDTHF